MTGPSNHPRAAAPAGSFTRAWGKDGPQRIETTGKRWSDEAEALFLDTLGVSCNVRLAAAAAGFSTVALYNRRRRDAGFAARWQDALEQGYAVLEAGLLRRAIEKVDGRAPDPDHPFPDMTVREAISILGLHRAAAKGQGNRPGWRARPRSLEEVSESILTKCEAIEAKRIARQASAPGDEA